MFQVWRPNAPRMSCARGEYLRNMPETLLDIWIDGLELDSLIWWSEKLEVQQSRIDVLGIREAIKEAIVSDDVGIQADRPVIESECF